MINIFLCKSTTYDLCGWGYLIRFELFRRDSVLRTISLFITSCAQEIQAIGKR
jgi:hypothetical protein